MTTLWPHQQAAHDKIAPTEGPLWERDANIVKRLWEINERFAAIDDEYKTLSAEARALRRERTANMIRMGKATAEVSGGE